VERAVSSQIKSAMISGLNRIVTNGSRELNLTPNGELLSRGTQIPEYVLQGCLAAFKSRNRPSLFGPNPTLMLSAAK
jgi:hypothetical protein